MTRSVRAVHPLLASHAAAADVSPEVRHYWDGGAGDEQTLTEASGAWARWRLRPRVLRDVSTVDTGLELLGSRLRTPVLVGPTALHGLAHPDGETATARGAADAGSLLVLSTRSSRPLEEVPVGPWWLQTYVVRDRRLTRALVQRAAAHGATALVLTGDTPYLGQRAVLGRAPLPPEQEQDPSVGLDVIAELAGASGLPVLVKGVLRGDDALACLDAGAAGVVVSNHGGRQLDRAVATADALAEVVEAVGGRAPVLVDGGLRSGLDVLCALALGADAVLLGRPVLWALAAEGAAGVQACLDALTADLAHCMGLAGARCLDELTSDLLA